MNYLKRISIVSIIFFMIVLISTISFAKTGVVNVEEVVVRAGSSTSTGVVMGIKGETEVEILGEENGFYKIKYNDTEGYVRSDLLNVKEEVVETEQEPIVENTVETETTEETPAENVEAEPTTDNVVISEATEELPKEFTLTTNIEVYLLPVFTSTRVTTIESGNNITINKKINNWSYITYENATGWVRNFNLENSVGTTVTEEEKPEEPENETTEQTAEIEKGYVNVSSVNMRKEDNTDSDILTSLIRNTEVKVIAISGEWYKVQYGDITGYIKQEFISETQTETTSRSEENRETASIETKTGYISVKIANVRANATTASKVLTTLKQKDEVQVAGTEGDFTKIILDDGTTAYVATRLVVYSLDEIPETPKAESNNSSTVVQNQTGSASGQGIVNFAQQFLDRDYVLGGTTPEGGFDCSGFVYYVFNSCGYSISRSCSVQANSGTAVSKSELQLGDIIFFNNTSSGAIGHVGIYIGNGQFIHAANPARGVVIDTINSGYYYTYYYSARRIV